MPLNYEEYERSKTQLCAVVTNAETGKAEYLYPTDLREFGCAPLKASCALPIATKGVKIGAETFFDGGVSDSIPLARAFEDGCSKAVVILTQDESYIKKPIKQTRAVKRILKKYPALAEAVLSRHEIYNRQLQYVKEQEKAGNCFVIRPAKPLNCSSIEKNLTKLECIYQLGYQQGKQNIERINDFLSK